MRYLLLVALLAGCSKQPEQPAHPNAAVIRKPLPPPCPPGYHLVGGNICQLDPAGDTVPGAP